MTHYAFILGRKHLLSIAELCQTFSEKKIIDLCPTALMAKFDEPLENPQKSLNSLGGSVKIAEIFATIKPSEVGSAGEIIANHLIEKFQGTTSKFNYAVSTYNLTGRHDLFLRKTLIFIKKRLQQEELKSRFINKNFKNPENAALKGEKILERGAEILVIQTHQNLYFAETKALQDFENYSKRDYDRPERDPHLGMLPPKLAQIMINLTGLNHLNEANQKSATLYDPFCGLGTVLTEGLLMGFKMIGSDVDNTVVVKSKKNIEYVAPHNPEWRLFPKDATRITKNDLPEKIDGVITESYLGPPVSQFPLPQNMEKTFQNIRNLMYDFMKALYPLLEPGTPVVLSLLVYRRPDRFFFVEKLIEPIMKLGYDIMPVIPYNVAKKYHLKVFDRPSLIYDRPDQIVGREIWKFIKK